MKTPTYAVYPPPVTGFPFLAVSFVKGSITAVAFETAEAAAEYNRRISGGAASLKH